MSMLSQPGSSTSSGMAPMDVVGKLRMTLLVGALFVAPSLSTSASTSPQSAGLARAAVFQTTPGLPVESISPVLHPPL